MQTSRAFELGRAVIASQSTNRELWLTTLITLSQDFTNSPAQCDSIDLQNVEIDALLDYLSSGSVWVRRRSDMYMTFDCKNVGKQLESQQLRQLADSIICAPVSSKNFLQLLY